MPREHSGCVLEICVKLTIGAVETLISSGKVSTAIDTVGDLCCSGSDYYMYYWPVYKCYGNGHAGYTSRYTWIIDILQSLCGQVFAFYRNGIYARTREQEP